MIGLTNGNEKNNLELIELLLNDFQGKVWIEDNGYQGRLKEDLMESIRETLDKYYEMKYEVETLSVRTEEMEKHIGKLESMLDRRKASYKKWEEVVENIR